MGLTGQEASVVKAFPLLVELLTEFSAVVGAGSDVWAVEEALGTEH